MGVAGNDVNNITHADDDDASTGSGDECAWVGELPDYAYTTKRMGGDILVDYRFATDNRNTGAQGRVSSIFMLTSGYNISKTEISRIVGMNVARDPLIGMDCEDSKVLAFDDGVYVIYGTVYYGVLADRGNSPTSTALATVEGITGVKSGDVYAIIIKAQPNNPTLTSGGLPYAGAYYGDSLEQMSKFPQTREEFETLTQKDIDNFYHPMKYRADAPYAPIRASESPAPRWHIVSNDKQNTYPKYKP